MEKKIIEIIISKIKKFVSGEIEVSDAKEAMIKDILSQSRSKAKGFLLSEDNPFLEDIKVRGEDLRNKKIITRQRGEPLTAETLEGLGIE